MSLLVGVPSYLAIHALPSDTTSSGLRYRSLRLPMGFYRQWIPSVGPLQFSYYCRGYFTHFGPHCAKQGFADVCESPKGGIIITHSRSDRA